MLSTTATGLGALLTPGVAASERPGSDRAKGRAGARGPPDHVDLPDQAEVPQMDGPIAVEGSKVALKPSREEWEAASLSDYPGIPDDAERISYDQVKQVEESLNEAIEAGEVEVEKRGQRNGFRLKSNVPDHAARGGRGR